MTYYAYIKNNVIDGCGQCPLSASGYTNIEIDEYTFNHIEDYVWNGEAVVVDPELNTKKLNAAKENKIAENDLKRDEALNEGVTYKGVLFYSDTDQKVNLLAIVSTMDDEQTIIWFGKDNQPLECTKEDLFNIGMLITQLHTYCWNRNAEIKHEIDEATTVEEVDSISTDYNPVFVQEEPDDEE